MSARAREVGDPQGALDRLLVLGAGDPVQPREHAQDLAAGELHVEVVQLRHDAHLQARLLGVLGHRIAEHGDLALVGERLRGEHPHRRGLPGAVGAEQPEADPARHLEIEPVDGRDRTEALDHAPDRDRRRSGAARGHARAGAIEATHIHEQQL